MPRPRRCRRVGIEPAVSYFKPAGIPIIELEQVVLTVDEFEAIRLKDLKEIEQEKAAEMMNISQPTFNRILRSARQKIADALVNSKAILIEGGSYKLEKEFGRVGRQGRGFGRR